MSFWEHRRVLVTGAGGFIGSHLVKALVDAGAEVIAMCQYNSRGAHPFIPTPHLHVRFADVRCHDSMEQLFAGQSIVFNLAAIISVPYSMRAIDSVISTNFLGVKNVLDLASKEGAWLVQVSTSEVYGTPESVPITTAHRMNPQSPYAASKVAADALVNSYVHTYDTDAVIVRPFNTYGPGQSPRAVIPTILGQMAAGGDIRLGSQHPRRDFTYVTDTVRGMMMAAEHAEAGDVIQLGTGRAGSIGELVQLCQQVTDATCHVEFDDARVRPNDSEVDVLLSDNSTAKAIGWEPQVELEDGLRQTWDFIRRVGMGNWDITKYNV